MRLRIVTPDSHQLLPHDPSRPVMSLSVNAVRAIVSLVAGPSPVVIELRNMSAGTESGATSDAK